MTDFLSRLPNNVEQKSKLLTLDTVSLSVNILHDFGMKAIKLWLHIHTEKINSRFNQDFIRKSLHIILIHKERDVAPW